MFKGIGFMMKFTWKAEKRCIIYQVLQQILTAVVPLADIVIPKYIIDELTGAQRTDVLLGWLGLLLAINLLGNWLIQFFSGSAFMLQGKVFAKFQTMMADQLSRCDFARLEDPSFWTPRPRRKNFCTPTGRGLAWC